MKENFNTVIMFNAYGVSDLNEIENFDNFFKFLKDRYTKEEIVNFVYEMVDNVGDETDPKFLDFYQSIPKDIIDTVNDEMEITDVVEKIRSGDVQSAMVEIDKGSFDLIKRTKDLIFKYNVRVSLFEKSLKMLEPYNEKDYQLFRTEIEKNRGKEKYKNSKVLFSKPTLGEQIKFFDIEIKSAKSESIEWESQLKKVIGELMTIDVIDNLIKIEEDSELIDLLLERRQDLLKVKNLYNKIINGEDCFNR